MKNKKYIARTIALAAVAGLLPVWTCVGAGTNDAGETAKSPAQRTWEESVDKGYKHLILHQGAMAYVEENPSLPRVLLIGDSISIGYTVPVRKLLAGKANVLRIPANDGPSTNGIQFLAQWLGDKKWDVIHFNWGLHDCFRKVPLAQYKANLETLVGQLQATGAKLIWASSTPIPENNPWKTTAGIEVEYNAAAKAIMEKHGIAINDLHAQVSPHFAEYVVKPGDVHFKGNGSAFLGQQVAAAIEKALGTEK